jgi:hypothetical protein
MRWSKLMGLVLRVILDIPVMLTPSPVILTPIKDDGLRELK